MALRDGSRLGVSMQDVFPHGCHLVPDSIIEAMDYDENARRQRARLAWRLVGLMSGASHMATRQAATRRVDGKRDAC
jgi:hypothetical protein